MENQQLNQRTNLNDTVDRVVKTLLPKASKNKNFFVNDIPDHFQLGKDAHVIASVLGGLLSTVVSYAKDSCIWLSAKLYGDVVLVHVKNSNGFRCNAIENQLQQLQRIAGKTRGTVGFTTHESNITSVTFGFSNLPV
jgi:hypothetical protein